MTEPTIHITPRRSAILEGHTNTIDVLVRVQAPDRPERGMPPRSPLNLGIVLDRSGSMSGEPLDEAKRCASFIIDGLLETDRASIVVYDGDVSVLVPSAPVSDKELIHSALRSLEPGGVTNLHGGWLSGAEQVSEFQTAGDNSRVLLLSDGCANQGLTDTHEIANQCRDLAELGVGTSTYGIGRSFNEDLMVEMANAGAGNHYYGETAEDLIEPFREEFELLESLFARNPILTTRAVSGVQVEMLNPYRQQGSCKWSLPDIAYDSEAWAILRLTVPPSSIQERDVHGNVTILECQIRYSDTKGQPQSTPSAWLSVPLLPARTFGSVAENELVRRRCGELEAANYQIRARRAAQNQDWDQVDYLIATARENSKNNEWMANVLDELAALARLREAAIFSKEALYSSGKSSRRLADKYEILRDHQDSDERIKPAYMRRKRRQGKSQFESRPGRGQSSP